jgi:pyrroloquinoline quinone biosynthesis protein D
VEVSLASVPRVHPETGAQRVGGRWAAASPDGGWHTFEDAEGVSEVGERIMDLIDGVRSVGDIIAVLCEEFDVERDVCAGETVRFVSLLVKKQVLQI